MNESMTARFGERITEIVISLEGKDISLQQRHFHDTAAHQAAAIYLGLSPKEGGERVRLTVMRKLFGEEK